MELEERAHRWRFRSLTLEVLTMLRMRWMLLPLVSLFGLLPFVTAASGALAAPPEDKFFTEVIEEQFDSPFFSELCGINAYYTLSGTIKFSFHKNELQIVRYSLTRTLNGPGGTLTSREVGMDQIRTELTSDGFVDTVHIAGRFNHSWVVPGYGPVELNVGSATFQVTFVWNEETKTYDFAGEELIHEAGPRERIDDTDTDAIAALCGYLD